MLPFNWGDAGKPDSASLEDGQDYPVIPHNSNLRKLVYGFPTYESHGGQKVDINLGNDLAEALPEFTKQMFVELTKDYKGDNLIFSPIR